MKLKKLKKEQIFLKKMKSIKKFQKIIIDRYTKKDYIKKYAKNSLRGLENFEKKLIKKFLKGKKKILVVGCGCGREILPLSKKGHDITGIDISPQMINESKKLAKKNNINLKLIVGNIADINLEKESFDIALMLNAVLDQIPSTKERIKSINNVAYSLKKNGMIICITNNFWYPRKNFVGYFEHLKEFFKFLIGKKEGKISDRVYESNGKIYVHLPSLFYLKKLFRKKFLIEFVSSINQIEKNKKPNKLSTFFGDALVLVCIKK